MAYTASKLIKIAEAEVGYLEKETNRNLESKTGNAGDENYTKYARDLKNAGYYNGNKNGYAWCDVFIDWCFFQLCGKDAKKAEHIICQTGDYGAGCIYSARYYRNAGRFYTSPKVGDQIFFGTKGKETHTGIVYKVTSSRVYTIEGNTSSAAGVVANGGGVFKKSYARSNKKIVGYGRPRYEEETTAPAKPTEPTKPAEPAKKTIKEDGKWGPKTTAASQKVMGTIVDGIVSNQPASCMKYVPAASTSSWEFKTSKYSAGSNLIKAIQKLVGVNRDGLCGKKTVKAMQEFLKKKKLYTGAIDCKMGPKTVTAWQKYINSKM